MEIVQKTTSTMKTNTYIVKNGGLVFVVDPGGDAKKIADNICSLGAKLDGILLTHAHFDHIGGVAELLRIAPQEEGHPAAVFLHKKDLDKICSYKNLAFAVGERVEKFTPDVLLKGGETISVAGLEVRVIHTPGHTVGGVCYEVEDKIFSGDTLFRDTFGRTDFYDGSFAQLKNSIVNKLFNLKGEYTVYPGHGVSTKLDYERKHNLILTE